MACYCRVSTHRQKVDSQKADILRWLTGQAMVPAAIQWFEDVESGTTLKRPAFDRMQQGIFAGTIKTVVVWKLDRISRRQREGVNLLADWCERGVRVVVITQQLDLSLTFRTPRMAIHLFFRGYFSHAQHTPTVLCCHRRRGDTPNAFASGA